MSDKFTLRRGLRNLVVAKVTADTADAYTVEEDVRQLLPVAELSVSVDQDKAQVYFDNTVFASVAREGNSEVSITGATLPADMMAYITGKTVDSVTGLVVDDGEAHDANFALGFIMDKIDGSSDYVWFLKGSFNVPDESAKTKDDSTDTNGSELTFTAIKTIHNFGSVEAPNHCKRVIMDTNKSELVESSDFFAQVVTPDNMATICKAKTV